MTVKMIKYCNVCSKEIDDEHENGIEFVPTHHGYSVKMRLVGESTHMCGKCFNKWLISLGRTIEKSYELTTEMT